MSNIEIPDIKPLKDAIDSKSDRHQLTPIAIHIFLGNFLLDKKSKSPFIEQQLLRENEQFDWGKSPILKKVIESEKEFESLIHNPQSLTNNITIIEPWEHVGLNDKKEEVRASKNVAFIFKKITNCDSILFPVWHTGLLDLDKLIVLLNSSIAIVLEGGNPSVHDSSQWTHPACSREDMLALVEKLILSRYYGSAPVIMICVSHQLAAEAHIRLLHRAVEEVLSTEYLENDSDRNSLAELKAVCERIKSVGDNLKIVKKNGSVVANNWTDPSFAVAQNEDKEIGSRHLLHYKTPNPFKTTVPIELINAHEVMANEFEGVIDKMLRYENIIAISMFHTDEVNEEAILLANWAYIILHNAIIPHRHIVASSHLSWLLQLPYSIEILASTEDKGEILTECSSTCINYKDFETGKVRRSFTCQFHPELLEDLREFGKRPESSYAELKKDDGIRLLARLFYEGMQE